MRASRLFLAVLLISITLSATSVIPASVERLTVESSHVVLAQVLDADYSLVSSKKAHDWLFVLQISVMLFWMIYSAISVLQNRDRTRQRAAGLLEDKSAH